MEAVRTRRPRDRRCAETRCRVVRPGPAVGSAGRQRVGYRGNVARMYGFTALTQSFFWMPIWVIFFQRRGLSLGEIGALEFGGMVLMAIAEVPTGAVADAWGRKTSLAIGAFLHGVATLGVTTEALSPVFLL